MNRYLITSLAISLFGAPLASAAENSRLAQTELNDPGSYLPSDKLNRALDVLRAAHGGMGSKCAHAMTALRTALAHMPAHSRMDDPDAGVAQNALAQNYEIAVEACTPDAQRLCQSPNTSSKTTSACKNLGAEENAIIPQRGE
ncbi:hypothetical protein [Acetobacter estunensis]|uniref:hypothetical protein n=1 Tax=Acetobacter estunensis TaxID=104097 RepID=UPI001C2CD46C|nr:hypothetical protein [Acetobacter estunensis]MBV1838713.1 hypothetical protein [Acetobacter estunensis]